MRKHAADQECNKIECNEILLNASKLEGTRGRVVSVKSYTIYKHHYMLLTPRRLEGGGQIRIIVTTSHMFHWVFIMYL